MRKGRATVISFPMVNSLLTGSKRTTGLVFTSGTSQISQDGGSFVTTSNNPAEIGSTGRYSLSLTAAEMAANHVHIKLEPIGADPNDVVYITGGQPSGSIVTNGGNTTSTFKTNLTDTVNDYWKDSLILFTSGSLVGQVKKIGAYDGTTKFITLASGFVFTGTPSGSDQFILVDV